MLERIWSALRQVGMNSPYVYGITKKKIFLLGRALESFTSGGFSCNYSLDADPVDLRDTDGCNELKGFFLSTGMEVLPVNNIVVNPSGRLSFCCEEERQLQSFCKSPRILTRA